MPYAYDPLLNEDDEENNPEAAPQLAGATQVMGGTSTQPSAGAAPKGPTRSDRFQNLNSYLEANNGNQFGEQFAGKVQGDVAKGAEAQAQAGDKFKTQADQATVNYNQSLVNEAIANPTDFTKDAGKVSQFKQQKDAQYTGPNTFADSANLYQTTYGATKKASNTAEAAQTEGGRFALLDNYFGRPEYNHGQKSLDNLLVSGNQNATQALNQARTNAQTQNQAFNEQTKELSNYAGTKRGETETARKSTRAALGIDENGRYVDGSGAIGGAVKGLDDKVTARRQAASTEYNDLDNTFGRASRFSEVDPALASHYGLTAQDIGGVSIQTPLFKPDGMLGAVAPRYSVTGSGEFYGINPHTYVSKVQDDLINRGSVASLDDAARMRALESLSDLSTPVVNTEKAGTYDDGRLTKFDKESFIRANQAKATQLQNEAQEAANQYWELFRTGQLPIEEAQRRFNETLSGIKGKYGAQ